ncbi:MAG: DNA-3-methyladenine glycosylase 2 family protein [Gammaproteobacteria bacterium]|nr:DNA-3-methyladenine glycosylase 2 family protein [Gammaproteobacteria bacterium]
MRTLTPELHAHFKRRARKLSPTLARELGTLGPIGFPQRRYCDLTTHLARVVVGQQLSTSAARSIWSRVEQAATERGIALAELCTADHAEALRRCGLSAAKVKALAAIGTAARDGRLSSRALARLAHDARHAALCSIWGIGRWTADVTSMFYFREPDIWPDGDLTVRNTFAGFVAEQSALTPADAAALFAPHRSFLALYMWRIADRGP